MAIPATAIANPTFDKPPRLRRRLPVSVRVFAAVMVLFGGISAIGVGIPAYRQYVAIAEIERLGGRVSLVERVPHWLKRWTRDESTRLFGQVRCVAFENRPAADARLARLDAFPELEILDLRGKAVVTDGDLRHISRLRHLKRLILANAKISDAGLTDLEGLDQLEQLYLSGSHVHVTDAGLKHLEGLTTLKRLSLVQTDVTENGIAELKRALPGLNISASGPTMQYPKRRWRNRRSANHAAATAW